MAKQPAKQAATVKRKPNKRRRSLGHSPLPEPIRPAQVQSEPEPAQESGGLFGLSALFENPKQAEPEPAQVAAVSSPGSITFSPSISEPLPGAPLGAEAERLLGAVPLTVGDDPAAGAADAIPGAGAPAVVGAGDFPLVDVVFESGDVQELLTGAHDWLAEYFASEHWRLSDRRGRLLARPLAEVVNGLWARYVPALLDGWCAQTPGASGLIAAAVIVYGPMMLQQISVSRERVAAAASKNMVREPARAAAPAPAPVRAAAGNPGGLVWGAAA